MNCRHPFSARPGARPGARARFALTTLLSLAAGVALGIFLVGLCLGWLDGQGQGPRASQVRVHGASRVSEKE